MKNLLELVRQNRRFFLITTLGALALRFLFVFHFHLVAGDSFIYGDIAKNWLQHHIYGLTDGGVVRPTLIRLPGYPAFLAVIFSIFGREHYGAALIVQALIDTNTCLVIAALALELAGTRAARMAYLLAALCPFTANYAGTALSETLAIFSAAHGLYYGIRGIKALESGKNAAGLWVMAGLWSAFSILLRPDGALVPFALGVGLLAALARLADKRRVVACGLLLAFVSLAPLVPWTVRNWHVFHVFQPLAPRYANDPGEFVPHGFNHWMKTWIVDYVSVDEIYWQVSGQPVDFHKLPERAFDSRPQYEETRRLLDAYNQQLSVDPQLDAQFERLADERVNNNPFRYFIWLPTLRIADMWLRPRTEMLPVDTRWWSFDDPSEDLFSIAWASLNLALVLLALRGWLDSKLGVCGLVLVLFVLVRSAFLGTLENPEPRYVLECFPVVLVYAGAALATMRSKTSTHHAA